MSSSSAEEDLQNIANWEEVDGSTPSCGTAGSLVCRYEFEGDIDAFESFISEKDAQYINGHALSRKL
jgi:hypothetical protein